MVADQIEIKHATLEDYVRTITVVCFLYWRKDGAEQQEWVLHAVRGELPMDEPRKRKCARCGNMRIALKKVYSDWWCVSCIAEFVAAKTMIERRELPSPIEDNT